MNGEEIILGKLLNYQGEKLKDVFETYQSLDFKDPTIKEYFDIAKGLFEAKGEVSLMEISMVKGSPIAPTAEYLIGIANGSIILGLI